MCDEQQSGMNKNIKTERSQESSVHSSASVLQQEEFKKQISQVMEQSLFKSWLNKRKTAPQSATNPSLTMSTNKHTEETLI